MRASALGQAKNSCAYLLHKNLNCSSFSTGFTERALTPRKDSILADDPIFCPNLLFSLLFPPQSSPRSTFHLLTLHHCHEKSPFFSQALRHRRYVWQRLRTPPKQSCLKYPDWLVRFILESLGGRREYHYGVSEKSPAWIRTNFRVSLSCDAGWNSKKNTEIASPVVISF